MRGNRSKATVALGVAAAGLAASYPYSATFAGGLASSGFLAALVGGLADWFAVEALFRRPLGIAWRTAVIPRNRERIFSDIVTLIEQDLLSPANILAKVGEYQLSAVLLAYLEQHGGREKVKELLSSLVRDMIVNCDPEEAGRLVDKLLKEGIDKVALAPLLIRMVDWTLANGYDRPVIDFILSRLGELVRTAAFVNMLEEILAAIFVRYEEGGILRSFVNKYIIKQNPRRAAEELAAAGGAFLAGLHDAAHPLRQSLRRWLMTANVHFRENRQLQDELESWKNSVVRSRPAIIAPLLADLIRTNQARLASGGPLALDEWLTGFVEAGVTSLATDKEQQAAFDQWALTQINRLVRRHHQVVGRLVSEELERFSDVMLVEFIESRVGEDLQMIRINGSLVGGLVGLAVYLITTLAERML